MEQSVTINSAWMIEKSVWGNSDGCLTDGQTPIREGHGRGSRESREIGSRAYTCRCTPPICGTAFPIICEQSLDNWPVPLHVRMPSCLRACPQTAIRFEGWKLLGLRTSCYFRFIHFYRRPCKMEIQGFEAPVYRLIATQSPRCKLFATLIF